MPFRRTGINLGGQRRHYYVAPGSQEIISIQLVSNVLMYRCGNQSMKTSFHSWVKNVLLITSPQLDPSITPTEPQWLTMVRFTHTASHSFELDHD